MSTLTFINTSWAMQASVTWSQMVNNRFMYRKLECSWNAKFMINSVWTWNIRVRNHIQVVVVMYRNGISNTNSPLRSGHLINADRGSYVWYYLQPMWWQDIGRTLRPISAAHSKTVLKNCWIGYQHRVFLKQHGIIFVYKKALISNPLLYRI